MLNFSFLLEAGSGSGTNQSGGGTWMTIIIFGVLFLFLYLFMIRPQKKQAKKDAEMRSALQVGDEVTTIGGIIGKVVSIKGETFVLETTKDKTKIRFLTAAIRSVDVKAADIAAAIMEAEKPEAKPEAKPEESADEAK
jgi:preprotein translocase subunit YajC